VQGYLLDTNIVAYWFDEKRPQYRSVNQHIQELPEGTPLAISSITLGEIEYGHRVESAVTTPRQEAYLEFIERELPMVLEIRKTTRLSYGWLRARIFEEYAPKNKRNKIRPEQLVDPITGLELGIDENDLWIAAQALEYNLVLVTNDNMARIRGACNDLMVENWAV
jgi:tRNA(fMet)-specific endonuclease VapC